MTSRTTLLVAVSVFASVLLAAGLGYVIGTAGGDDAAPATTTTTRAEPSTTTSASASTSTTASTSSTTSIVPPQTKDPFVRPRPDNVIAAEITHPELLAISRTYSLYLEPINSGVPEAAYVTLGPAITRNNTAEAWAEGQQTSQLWNFQILEITRVDGDTLDVRVSFQSTQEAPFGRLPGETCTSWDITHRLVRSQSSNDPTWLINRSSQNPGSPTSCMDNPPDR